MPSPSLTPAELARVRAGICACGCGCSIVWHRSKGPYSTSGEPFEIDPQLPIYASPACKQRAYRARRKAGRVIPQDTRRRDALLAEAREWQERAQEAARVAAQYRQLEAQYQARALALCEQAGGQLYIPGTEPKASKRKGA